MRGQKQKNCTSRQPAKRSTGLDGSIGDLFRDYGEQYIRKFKPPIQHIKFIRSVRVCKTPVLGGRAIVCTDCGHQHRIYLSCGNSQCPLCQSIKRLQWQDSLSVKMFNVPYSHVIFTVPRELHRIARNNKRGFYGLILRSAWSSTKKVCADPENLGGLPAMIAVLHTFGSDMKYHLHVHALVSFGGLSSNRWVWPKRKKWIGSFRTMSREWKNALISEMHKAIKKKRIKPTVDHQQVVASIENKRWTVKQVPPTMHVERIQEYLSRYINRIAISKSRLSYSRKLKQVDILYNDYRNQVDGQPAPKKSKSLSPLLAMEQILQHLLPPYFQKVRYYGLHAPTTYKRLAHKIPQKLKNDAQSIKTLFSILKTLLQSEPYQCEHCESKAYQIIKLRKDPYWKLEFINLPNMRGPPINIIHINNLRS